MNGRLKYVITSRRDDLSVIVTYKNREFSLMQRGTIQEAFAIADETGVKSFVSQILCSFKPYADNTIFEAIDQIAADIIAVANGNFLELTNSIGEREKWPSEMEYLP